MANAKLTALTNLAAPIGTDIIYVVDDPGASPISKKATLASLPDALGLGTGNNVVFTGVSTTGGFLNVGAPSELTIDTGVITVTRSNHTVETESGAGSDALTDIQGGSVGDILILSAADNAHTVTVTDGTGTIRCEGDFDLDHTTDSITFIKRATYWDELARSNNAA